MSSSSSSHATPRYRSSARLAERQMSQFIDPPEKDVTRLNLDRIDLDKVNVRRLSFSLLKEFCGKYRRLARAKGNEVPVVDLRASRSLLLKWAEDAQARRNGEAPGRKDPFAPAVPADATIAPRRRSFRPSSAPSSGAAENAAAAGGGNSRATTGNSSSGGGGATTSGSTSTKANATPVAPPPPAYRPTSAQRPNAATAPGLTPSAFGPPAKRPTVTTAAAAASPYSAPRDRYRAYDDRRYDERNDLMERQALPPPPARASDITMRGTSGLLAHSNSNNVNNNHNFNNNNNSNNSGTVDGDINPHSAAPYNDEQPRAKRPAPPPPARRSPPRRDGRRTQRPSSGRGGGSGSRDARSRSPRRR